MYTLQLKNNNYINLCTIIIVGFIWGSYPGEFQKPYTTLEIGIN